MGLKPLVEVSWKGCAIRIGRRGSRKGDFQGLRNPGEISDGEKHSCARKESRSRREMAPCWPPSPSDPVSLVALQAASSSKRSLDWPTKEMNGRGFAGRRPLRVLLAGIVTVGFLGVTLTSHPSIATSSFDPMQCAPSDLGNLLVVTAAAFWSWSLLGVPYVRLRNGHVVIANPLRQWTLPLEEVRWLEGRWPYPLAEWRGRRIPLVAFEKSRIAVGQGDDPISEYKGRRRRAVGLEHDSGKSEAPLESLVIGVRWRLTPVQCIILGGALWYLWGVCA